MSDGDEPEGDGALEVPARVIAGWLRERGWFQKNLAEATGMTEKHVSQLLTGKISLSVPVAVLVERVTGLSADLLMIMQVKHDVARARLRLGPEL